MFKYGRRRSCYTIYLDSVVLSLSCARRRFPCAELIKCVLAPEVLLLFFFFVYAITLLPRGNVYYTINRSVITTEIILATVIYLLSGHFLQPLKTLIWASSCLVSIFVCRAAKSKSFEAVCFGLQVKRELASVVIFESHAKAGTVCESSSVTEYIFPSVKRSFSLSDSAGPLWGQVEATELNHPF